MDSAVSPTPRSPRRGLFFRTAPRGQYPTGSTRYAALTIRLKAPQSGRPSTLRQLFEIDIAGRARDTLAEKCGVKSGCAQEVREKNISNSRFSSFWRMGWDSNPRDPYGLPVFKTGAFSRSATHPRRGTDHI